MRALILILVAAALCSLSVGRQTDRMGLREHWPRAKIDFLQRRPTTVFRASGKNAVKYSPYRKSDDNNFPVAMEDAWSPQGSKTSSPQALENSEDVLPLSSFARPTFNISSALQLVHLGKSGEKYRWTALGEAMTASNPQVAASKPSPTSWAVDKVDTLFDIYPLQQAGKPAGNFKTSGGSVFNKTFYDVDVIQWNINPKYTEMSDAISQKWNATQPSFVKQLSLVPAEIYSVKEYESLLYQNLIVRFMLKRSEKAPSDAFYPYRGPSHLNVTCETYRYNGPRYRTPEVSCQLEAMPSLFNCKQEEMGLEKLKTTLETLQNKPVLEVTSACLKTEGDKREWILKSKTEAERSEIFELLEVAGQFSLKNVRQENREKFLQVPQLEQAKLFEGLIKPAIELHMNGLLKTGAKTYKINQVYNILEKFVLYGRQYKVMVEVAEIENFINQEKKQVSFESGKGDVGCYVFSNDLVEFPERDPGLFFFSSQLRDKLMVSCERIPKEPFPFGAFSFVTPEIQSSVIPKLLVPSGRSHA